MKSNSRTAFAKREKSIGRFLGISALFTLLGPPIGELVVSICLGFLAATPQLGARDWMEAINAFLTVTFFGAIFGLPIAYFVGSLPATGVGLAVALWERHKGLISWRVTLSATLVSWLFFAIRAGGLIETDDGTRVWQISLLLGHLAAAGVCWWSARRFLGRA
ncbi:hypothetical protein [Parasphingorhabdus sp.]|uniref:hypothetical protein n=1 Tax=Parasphingorhabdus sp. TaxID=2709688 RepID=UPI0035935F23